MKTPIALFSWLGPALRRVAVLNREIESAPQLLCSDILGWNLIFWDNHYHTLEQTAGPFAPPSCPPGHETIYSAFEEIFRRTAVMDNNFQFTAFGFTVKIVGEKWIGYNEGTPDTISGESLEILLHKLKALRDSKLKIFVHVGLPKTGTTYLQHHVFPHLTNVHYVSWDSDFFSQHFQLIKYMYSLARTDDIKFAYEQYLYTFDECTILISDESLTTPWDKGRGIGNAILSLKTIFPSAHIIITLREQVSLLRSLFFQSKRYGWSLSFIDFVRWDKDSQRFKEPDFDSFPNIDIAYFRYDKLIQLFQEHFSAISVLHYENFKNNPERFVSHIEHILQTKFFKALPSDYENKRLGLIGSLLLYCLNRFLGAAFRKRITPTINRIDGYAYIEYDPVPAFIVPKIKQYFTASNTLLQKTFKIHNKP